MSIGISSALELEPESYAELLNLDEPLAASSSRPDYGLHACDGCLRRSWLLTALAGYLDARRHDLQRLTRLLTLSDGDLVRALGAHKRQDLREQYESFERSRVRLGLCAAAICRHDPNYPYMLNQAQALGTPAVLYIDGDVERFKTMFTEPAVAIVGIRKATDYGIEIARSMARDLTAAGVPVISGLAEGIAAAAHLGAIDAGGPTLTVMPGGVDICYPANKRALFASMKGSGCAVSELPCGFRMRRWCYAGRSRIVTGLARVVVVVEADKSPVDLMVANLARMLGKTVAAVPGRVTSSSSRGTHSLLTQGARLVEGAQDILDLLYGVGARHVPPPGPDLEPALQSIIEKVGSGHDTVNKLAATGLDPQDALMALTELELMGKITRGDGGRYVPCAGLGVAPS
ncbi:MAG TPA: DNA-processing protein DprA [Solirubrobacteraceae bacterium]|jgi:DNA processing protein